MKLPVILRTFSLLPLLAIVAACVPPQKPGTGPGMSNVIEHPIKLKVNHSSGVYTLVIDEPNTPNCDGTPYKKGCILLNQGDVAQIQFRLLQRENWHITTMQICSGDEKPDDFDSGCSLSPEQRAEFLATDLAYFVYPDEKGIMGLTALSTDLNAFYFRDFNWIEGDYFYRIQVCPDADHEPEECIWTDPPIRNKGTK